jgi:hypothetical protein
VSFGFKSWKNDEIIHSVNNFITEKFVGTCQLSHFIGIENLLLPALIFLSI